MTLLSVDKPSFEIRKATIGDVAAMVSLIPISVRGLGRDDYTDAQLEAGLASGAWAVDSQLIRDGTYFVAEAGSVIIGCGGWSFRRTLYGGDSLGSGREPERLDPATDAARIRAFFVHLDWARRGIGRAILQRCEEEATARGFTAAELLATLPGVGLYRSLGYVGEEPKEYDLNGVPIHFVPMRKPLAQPSCQEA